MSNVLSFDPLLTPNQRRDHLAHVLFRDAAEQWIKTREPYVRPRTVANLKTHISSLSAFLGHLPLGAITANWVSEYQGRRQRQSCGASAINHEVSVLRQILTRSGLWENIRLEYQPLPLPRYTKARVLSDREREHFLATCRQYPQLHLVFHVQRITANTTVPVGELRGCRLRDFDAANRCLYVPDETVKNQFRARVIPLNDEALESLKWLVARGRIKGSVRPDHFILPFRVHRALYDPERPASESVLRQKFKDACILSGIDHRCYDWRHQAITELLETPGIPEETIKSIAGHVSKRILETYSHVRIEAKRDAVELLAKRRAQRRTGRLA